MKHILFSVLIIYSIITNSSSTKSKLRSSETLPTVPQSQNIKTNIGFIQPIGIHGAPKLNISTLLSDSHKDQRHKLSFYIADREKENVEREPSVEEKPRDGEEEDNRDDQGDDNIEGDDNDSEQEPVMRNAPGVDDDLFYDFDDDELRVNIRK